MPLIWSKELSAYIQWLPVTKLQLEWFLCDQPSSRFDQGWYEQLLNIHGNEPHRVPPTKIQDGNYYRALVTGMKPAEIKEYIAWLDDKGDGFFHIPTSAEWLKVYREFSTQPAIDVGEVDCLRGFTERTRSLLRQLDRVARVLAEKPVPGTSARPISLADQMFMRNGVMEWVKWKLAGEGHAPRDYGGRGCPFHRNLVSNSRDFTAEAAPHDPGSKYDELGPSRHDFRGYGFRLIRREL
jgi:hypothetical protein